MYILDGASALAAVRDKKEVEVSIASWLKRAKTRRERSEQNKNG